MTHGGGNVLLWVFRRYCCTLGTIWKDFALGSSWNGKLCMNTNLPIKILLRIQAQSLINSINIFCDMFYFPATVYPQNPKFWLFTTLKRQNSTHLKNSNFFSENFREWGIDFQYNVSHIAPDTAAFLWNTNVNTNHDVHMEYEFSAKNTNNSTAKSRMRLDLSQDTTTFRALLECGVYVFYVYIWLISNESAPRRI